MPAEVLLTEVRAAVERARARGIGEPVIRRVLMSCAKLPGGCRRKLCVYLPRSIAMELETEAARLGRSPIWLQAGGTELKLGGGGSGASSSTVPGQLQLVRGDAPVDQDEYDFEPTEGSFPPLQPYQHAIPELAGVCSPELSLTVDGESLTTEIGSEGYSGSGDKGGPHGL